MFLVKARELTLEKKTRTQENGHHFFFKWEMSILKNNQILLDKLFD